MSLERVEKTHRVRFSTYKWFFDAATNHYVVRTPENTLTSLFGNSAMALIVRVFLF